MTPAQVRDELVARALWVDGTRLWLASAAHVALSWERDEGGALVARGPTLAEVAQLERRAVYVDAREREAALSLLREIARG